MLSFYPAWLSLSWFYLDVGEGGYSERVVECSERRNANAGASLMLLSVCSLSLSLSLWYIFFVFIVVCAGDMISEQQHWKDKVFKLKQAAAETIKRNRIRLRIEKLKRFLCHSVTFSCCYIVFWSFIYLLITRFLKVRKRKTIYFRNISLFHLRKKDKDAPLSFM
jgi:hypothetical protein